MGSLLAMVMSEAMEELERICRDEDGLVDDVDGDSNERDEKLCDEDEKAPVKIPADTVLGGKYENSLEAKLFGVQRPTHMP